MTCVEALVDARGRGRALGAFNVYTLEGALAVARGAAAARRAAIVQLHPEHALFVHLLCQRHQHLASGGGAHVRAVHAALLAHYHSVGRLDAVAILWHRRHRASAAAATG